MNSTLINTHNKFKIIDILKELHKVGEGERSGFNEIEGDGILIGLGFDIPSDFDKEIETADLQTLREYFKEVTEYISKNI
tara:strand:- start:347 stop:586 length:240 start_codon:yes stop_codon:yes gene_type:complete